MDTTSILGVLAIKQLLRDIALHKYHVDLPLEIVDLIIDHAEFWVKTSVNAKREEHQRGPDVACARGNTPKEDVFVLRSLPVGVLPEQIDLDTHLGLVDGFTRAPPDTKYYPQPTQENKSQTERMIQHWVKSNALKDIKQPCRKIVFTIWSHDQGWGGLPMHRGTFDGSYTWFDVGRERLEAHKFGSDAGPEYMHRLHLPLDPDNAHKPEGQQPEGQQPEGQQPEGQQPEGQQPEGQQEITCILRTIDPPVAPHIIYHPRLPLRRHIVRNRTAHSALQKHVITWSHMDNINADDVVDGTRLATAFDECGRGRGSRDGKFVRDLKVGDTVTIWARARFPGWTNSVEYCQIDLYWAI